MDILDIQVYFVRQILDGLQYIGAPLVQKTSFLFFVLFFNKRTARFKKDPSPNQFFLSLFWCPISKNVDFQNI